MVMGVNNRDVEAMQRLLIELFEKRASSQRTVEVRLYL